MHLDSAYVVDLLSLKVVLMGYLELPLLGIKLLSFILDLQLFPPGLYTFSILSYLTEHHGSSLLFTLDGITPMVRHPEIPAIHGVGFCFDLLYNIVLVI